MAGGSRASTSPGSPDSESVKRRVGRPRATGVEPTGDVRAQILEAASNLFASQGYAGTSTRQIAAAVGLRQGSLTYYFSRKQDIVVELVRESLHTTFDHAAALAGSGLPASAQFYRFAHSDCLSLCEDEMNTATLLLQPEIRSLTSIEADAERRRLADLYADLIRRARDDGDFVTDDVEFAATASIGLVESVAAWFERGSWEHSVACADHVARTIVGGLVADNDRLARIIATASNAPAAADSSPRSRTL